MPIVRDVHARPLRSLRLSITDRCNLRCGYCMPEESYTWLPKRDLLTYEEHAALVEALVPYGVSKVRLTGGEPLLRRDVADLVRRLAGVSGLSDLALTTNAILLSELAGELREAGLDRVTVSLDTLRRDRFVELTRRDELDRVLAGIAALADAGFTGTKLNTVVMRGQNDDELVELLAFGREHGIEVRFIEYMDVGGATRWSMDAVVPIEEILQRVRDGLGEVEPVEAARTSAPADRFRVGGEGLVFGVIASTTRPFCAGCDRARVTADGRFFGCLYARDGVGVAGVLRERGAEAAARVIAGSWGERRDRGAEERLEREERGVLADASELKGEPHLEMHTRGG